MAKNYVDFIKDSMTKPELAKEYLPQRTRGEFRAFFTKHNYLGVTDEDCKTLEEAGEAYQGGITFELDLFTTGGGCY